MRPFPLTPIALLTLLTACGGGGTAPTPDPDTPPLAPFQGPEFDTSILAQQRKALEAFEQITEQAKNSPVVPMQSDGRGCEGAPGSAACPLPQARPMAVSGIDMVTAMNDPTSVAPGGKAWLELPAPPAKSTQEDIQGSTLVPDPKAMLAYNPAAAGAVVPKSAQDNLSKAAMAVPQSLTSNGGAHIVDPTSGTNARRVKVFISAKFKGASDWSQTVCSGTLIDSQWVLTAAHCMWTEAWDNGGYPWTVYISPGYSNGKQPYERAYATQILVPSDWKNKSTAGGNDIAWFKLNRAIGGLTGWDGVSYFAPAFTTGSSYLPGNSQAACNDALATDLFAQAYPADREFAYPGKAKVTGEDMWQVDFRFDACLQPSHLSVKYPQGGGASGSAALMRMPGSGMSLAKAIFEQKGAEARYNRITYEHVNAISQSITQGSALTTQVDLAPASFRLTTSTKDSQPATVNAPAIQFKVGEDAYLVFWVHNNSFVKEFKGNLNYSVYLSQNRSVDPSTDQKVASFTIANASIKPKSSYVTTPQLKVPCPLFNASTYYLGVVINNADADLSNNATSGKGAVAAIALDKVCTVALPVGHWVVTAP